jgi:phosphoribosyl 1,2-cyclic phosphodiesterase
VRYGGNTACVELQTNAGTSFVFDSGTGIRELGLHLKRQGGPITVHLMLGHSHWDHIAGFPFFVPAFAPGNRILIYGARGVDRSLLDVFAGQMNYTYFPVPLGDLQAALEFCELGEGEMRVEDAVIRTHLLNHTAICLGYRIEADGVSVAYITDHEPYSLVDGAAKAGKAMGRGLHAGPIQGGDRRLIEFVRGVDLLIQDAQYTHEELVAHRGWGHSSADYVTDVAVEANARRAALFHHEPTHSDDDLDRIVENAQNRARQAGSPVEIFGAAEGLEILL